MTMQTYDPKRAYEFTRNVRFQGVDYRAGDLLPEGIPPRKIEQLIRQRMARPTDSAAPRPTKPAKPMKPAEPEVSDRAEAPAPKPVSKETVDVDALKRPELMKMCAKHGLSVNGNNETLRSRLRSVLD